MKNLQSRALLLARQRQEPLLNNAQLIGYRKRGSRKPSFYEYIKEKKIVIGVEDKKYKIGDLIVIAEGHQVRAIAGIKETPKPITNDNSLESEFQKLEIDYDTWVNYANADWYELKPDERFSCQLQQGIVRVNPSNKAYKKAIQI